MSNEQKKKNSTNEVKINSDDLFYARQNALINFSRLSKQKQKEIDNKVAVLAKNTIFIYHQHPKVLFLLLKISF